VFIQSRDSRPLDRYFPDLTTRCLLRCRTAASMVEIVIATPHGLDFDALQMRLHPAASRVAKLAKETPASFVAFDLLAVDGHDLRALPQRERRARLERLLTGAKPPIYLTPMTTDRGVASDWLTRFEGAGLDGVVVKPENGTYEPGKRAMIKVKHARTADCVVAGFRWHKAGKNRLVGSLLLGLYDDKGALQHVGVTSSFTMAMREQLAVELAPLRERALDDHPWRDWASADEMNEDAGRPEPLERGQGPVVGAAAHRARVRGEVRPHAGRSLSPCRHLPALAPRQAARSLPLRSARGYGLMSCEGFRRGPLNH
jgi:ATP-dependent DNA ligase